MMSVSNPLRACLFMSLTGLLASCASNLPVEITHAPPDNPAVSAVRQQAGQYLGRNVRWGGTIVAVENKADMTWIEILAVPLNSYGRPAGYDDSNDGRFLVRIDGFLEPEIYNKGRRLTVYGTLESRIVRQIDEHPYAYPLVHASHYHLWREDDYSPQYHYAAYPHFYHPYYVHPYYRLHYGHRHFFWPRYGYYPGYYYPY